MGDMDSALGAVLANNSSHSMRADFLEAVEKVIGGRLDLSSDEASQLPAPVAGACAMVCGDIGATIASLVIQTNQRADQCARESRHAAECAEEAANQAEVAEMREKADNLLTGGIVTGVVKAGGASMTIASVGVSASSDSAGATKTAAWLKGASQIQDAKEVAVKGGFDSMNTHCDIRAKQHAEDASRASHAREDAKDESAAAHKMIDAALDFYREFSSAQSAANQAALHRA